MIVLPHVHSIPKYTHKRLSRGCLYQGLSSAPLFGGCIILWAFGWMSSAYRDLGSGCQAISQNLSRERTFKPTFPIGNRRCVFSLRWERAYRERILMLLRRVVQRLDKQHRSIVALLRRRREPPDTTQQPPADKQGSARAPSPRQSLPVPGGHAKQQPRPAPAPSDTQPYRPGAGRQTRQRSRPATAPTTTS